MSATGRGGVRVPQDCYETPSWCVDRLLETFIPYPSGHWIDPCAGSGSIIRAVNHHSKPGRWTAMEIRERCRQPLSRLADAVFIGDVLKELHGDRYDVLFTNPPYSLAEEFYQLGRQIADTTVLLLRTNFLESEKRAHLWQMDCPSIYVLPNRPSFTGGEGTDATSYAWFVWKQARSKVGTVQVLNVASKGDRRATELVAYENAQRYFEDSAQLPLAGVM